MASHQVSLILDENNIPFFESVFEEEAEAILLNLIEEGVHKNKWRFDVYFDGNPNKNDVQKNIQKAAKKAGIKEPSFDISQIIQKNWLEESFKSFPPVSYGRYYVYGSHIVDPQPDGKIALQIDAATAFGSGEHATTQGCLKALDDVLETTIPKDILDMGCGSGILSMAAFKVVDGAVVDAADIDPDSVDMTAKNAKVNNVDLSVFQSNGYEKVSKEYDLIFSNILAKPLVDMAPDLNKHLKKGGHAILSGFLTEQEPMVAKAHEDLGLLKVSSFHIKEWGTMIVKRT